jgi:hypothetical protein
MVLCGLSFPPGRLPYAGENIQQHKFAIRRLQQVKDQTPDIGGVASILIIFIHY